MAPGKRSSIPPLLIVERMLLVLAVVALGWYVTARVTTVVYQAWQDRQLDTLRETQQTAQKGQDVLLPSGGAPRALPRRPLVGRIQVPRLGLSAIVREGADDGTLKRAVGHIPETPLPGEPGNVAFAGHRDTFFRPLKDIRDGDRIVVTTPEGEFDYIVRERRIVPPTDVSVLDPTPRPTLTLVTCHPFNFVGNAPNRFIVRAEQADAATPTAGVSTHPPAAPMPGAAPQQAAAVAATAGQRIPRAVAEQPREMRRVSVRKPSPPKPKAKTKNTKKPNRNPFRPLLRLFR